MSDKRSDAGPSPEVVQRVLEAFLILTIDEVIEPLKSISGEESASSRLVEDAINGMKSVAHAASLPFAMTSERVHHLYFDRLFSAERIRALKEASGLGGLSPELERKALGIARNRMAEFSSSAEGSNYFRDAIVYELDSALRSREIADAAFQLLAQALVSTWTVFEVFMSSFIKAMINADPALATKVLNAPQTRAHFGKPAIGIEAIDAHGFDLTSSMGSILFEDRRLDSLTVIRDLTEVVIPNPEALSALNGETIWLLNQRRHLFVHKQGIVDSDYLRRTSDSLPVGARLPITSQDIEQYLRTVAKAIWAVVNASGSEPTGAVSG